MSDLNLTSGPGTLQRVESEAGPAEAFFRAEAERAVAEPPNGQPDLRRALHGGDSTESTAEHHLLQQPLQHRG